MPESLKEKSAEGRLLEVFVNNNKLSNEIIFGVDRMFIDKIERREAIIFSLRYETIFS